MDLGKPETLTPMESSTSSSNKMETTSAPTVESHEPNTNTASTTCENAGKSTQHDEIPKNEETSGFQQQSSQGNIFEFFNLSIIF